MSAVSVTQLQWDLAGLGYMPFDIDGIDGPQTTGATRAFQADRCITVDGIDGPQTDGQLSAVVMQVQAAAGAAQDGLYGPATKQAVTSYQAAHGLSADGQAGPDTMQAMGIQRVEECSAPPPPASGISVAQLQWDLAGLGYMPFDIDGIDGPQTTGATMAFQSDRCISVDGIAGPQTDGQLSAVIQRVQAAAGASQDGLYGPATKQAVANYQAAHGLSADGQAGPDTMGSMGIQRVVPCGSSGPPPPVHGSWGVDSVTPIAQALGGVRSSAGATPSFWLRYVSDYNNTADEITSSEVALAHQNGIRIMLLSADEGPSSDVGSANGTADGQRAVADARSRVGAPAGTLIIKDIEDTTDAAFLSAWYNAVEGAGYRAGFYLNPSHSDIQSDFCGAVAAVPAMRSAIIDSYEPLVDFGPVGPGSAPSLSRAETLQCGGVVDIYQYSQENGGDLYDQDVFNPSTPGTL